MFSSKGLVALLFGWVTLGVGMQTPAWAFERSFHGKTASIVFPDARVAKLARAACEGDTAAVANQVRIGADPNFTGLDGISPLIWANLCRNERGVMALIYSGADPNKVIDDDYSPVYHAVTGPIPILRTYLRSGGDPNAGSKQSRRSALMEAMSIGINGGGWQRYYLLLEAGADVNRIYGSYNTIAVFAADMAQYEKLAELLEHGYSNNLIQLGAHVQSRAIRPDLEPMRARVKAMLEDRGVKFQAPLGAAN